MYVKQRQDLLDFNVGIPYQRLISHKPGFTQLKRWVPVLAYGDEGGTVFTPCGAFASIDLQYSVRKVITIKVKEA